MNSNYIKDVVLDKVIKDLHDVDFDEDLTDDSMLYGVLMDVLVPLFHQYCVNRDFNNLKSAIKTFMVWIHQGLLDQLIEDYDPEEDMG